MKKLILTIAGLFAVLLSFADTIDRQQAQSIAQRWLGTDVTEASYGSDAFYIFNGTQGGWIIVSAEDASTPVLGYSETGSINTKNLPSNFKSWMGGYEKAIRSARAEGLKPTTEVKALWKTAGYRTKAATQKVLETPLWGQESPYNDQCPEVSESGRTYRAVTGCVATAMAEVIRYHQWPEHGTGTIGGYSYTSDYSKTVNIPSYSIDEHTYDYSLMPMQYNGMEKTAQKTAVAQLMHDCGVMVQAMYNYNTGTGAYSEYIADALVNHMSYAPTVQFLYREAYTDAEWTVLIEKEIDAGRPLIYAGDDPKEGGHQFVCDGYDTRDYIRINWGWSGDDNGFFTLNLKIPGSYTFSNGQSMLIGLQPNKGESYPVMAGPLIYEMADGSSTGLALKSGTVLSKSFNLSANAIFNVSYSRKYTGAVKAALVNWQGQLKEYVSSESSLTIDGYSLVKLDNIQCSIKGDVTFGDRVVLYYKTSDGKWEMIKGNYSEGNSSNTYLCSSIPAVDAAFIPVPENPTAGETFFFELVPGSSPVKSVTWYYDGTKQSGISANLTAGTHKIRADVTFKDGTTEKLNAVIVVK